MSSVFTRRSLLASALALAAMPRVFKGADSNRPGRRLLTRIPPRPVGAMTGSAFAAATAGVAGITRQRRAVQELLAGNVPTFLRSTVPVALRAPIAPGSQSVNMASPPVAWVWVLPDYLAVGSDEDFLCIPLTLPRAQAIAQAWDMSLPTRKIVDEIFHDAEVRLPPQPMTPGPKMRSSDYYLRHQRLIEESRSGHPLGALTAGHKKDIVLTNKLLRRSDRIAIYGWHRAEGDPIQPVSTVHGARYADYSHGLRLVDSQVLFRGETRRLDALLTDPSSATVFSFEGELPRSLLPVLAD